MSAQHFQFGRERDARIRQLANEHVVTHRHFRQYFSTDQACRRRLLIHRQRGWLRVVGMLTEEPGRPQYVYSNRINPPLQDLYHEVCVTDFALAYQDRARQVAVFRHPKHINGKVDCDAEIIYGNPPRLLYVEMDMGTESLSFVQEHQLRYANAQNLLPQSESDDHPTYRGVSDLQRVRLAYVTLSQRRLVNLQRVSQAVSHLAVFSTLPEILADPFGPIWRDSHGGQGRLPKLEPAPQRTE